jgi:hypothetical protein
MVQLVEYKKLASCLERRIFDLHKECEKKDEEIALLKQQCMSFVAYWLSQSYVILLISLFSSETVKECIFCDFFLQRVLLPEIRFFCEIQILRENESAPGRSFIF